MTMPISPLHSLKSCSTAKFRVVLFKLGCALGSSGELLKNLNVYISEGI
jgi:hypothetical protein